MTGRTWSTVVVGIIGIVLGVVGAGWLSLSGLDLRGGVFERGTAWEEGESQYGVVIGCCLLLLWLASVVVVVLVSHRDRPSRRVRVLGTTVAWVSIVIVTTLTLVSLAVLPRTYDYAP